MGFEIKVDEKRLAQIQKECEEEFYRRYQQQLRAQFASLLDTEFCNNNGVVIRPEGEITKQVREKIKAFISSEKTQKRLDLYIERLFDTETEGVDEHVKKAFKKLFKKEAFQRLEQVQKPPA